MSLNTHKRIKVLLAGGGTGGHIFPGVALAEEFMKRKDKKIECLMVISARPLDELLLKKEGLPYKVLPIKGIHWALSIKAIMDIYRYALSFLYSWQIISAYSPDLIIGLGAYLSFPLVTVGRIKGIVTLIQEQNLLPGKANRILGRWVDGIFVSFPQSMTFFPHNRTKMLGNPIRALPSQRDKKILRGKWNLNPDLFTILVCGGSTGAHSINIKATEAFRIMNEKGKAFQVIHQTGKEDCEFVSGFYKNESLIALVEPFFDRMMEMYFLADIIISRSGAGVISELTAIGKPAILIPYPHAKAQHQKLNAIAMVSAGAARMIDDDNCTGEILANELMDLSSTPELLEAMSSAGFKMGRPEAAKAICDQAISWLEEKIKNKKQTNNAP